MKIKIRLDMEQDDLEVRGNAVASGDADVDRAQEDEILRRLNHGDVAAWFHAIVTATAEVDGHVFQGKAHLGACCYESEEAFKRDAYYRDLVEDAIKNLKGDIAAASRRALAAVKATIAFNEGKVEIEEEP